jgi:large subunit ribosomal protein L14
MIQIGSFLNIIDNSGAKTAQCLKIINSGYKQRYAGIGDVLLVSVKSINLSKTSKVKKGNLYKAVLIKTKNFLLDDSFFNYRKFYDNSIVLINNKNKLLGTRIFSQIPKMFKKTRFLKLISLSSGLIK